MHKQEEEAFENMQKENTIETINFLPIHDSQLEPRRHTRHSHEEVSWKFNNIPVASTYSIQHTRPEKRKNISFEDQQCFTSEDNGADDSNNQQITHSPFIAHYQNMQQVYKKNFDFGTQWIGRKQYFASNFVDPLRVEKNSLQYYTVGCQASEDSPTSGKFCEFDADFECGNLLCAYKVCQGEYDLVLQNDFNTKGNTQWFYFRITNPPKKQSIKINIVNMRKSDSLFNYGMLPCVHSLQEQKKNKRGWIRSGKNVRYFKNQHQIQNSRRYYYTLTFIISTSHQNDVLRIAQCYPYTLTDLNNYLDSIDKIKYKKEMMDRDTILTTIGRNKVQVLTIKESNPKIKNRPYIIIIARQHPGETPGSFVCEGLIDFLLSKQKESQYLRKNYEIKILPMVNPDGVVVGNYRTNLLGFDLNRRWQGSRTKNLHEAFFIKKYLINLLRGRQAAFILDLHGHSRKLFSFFYGNPSSSPVDARIFPLICSKLGPQLIRFEDSTFLSEQSKRNTARVQFGLCFRTLNVFTFETSFFGYYGQDKEKKHFTMDGYRQLGYILGKSIYIHERGKQLNDQASDIKEAALYKKCYNQLRNNMHLIALGDKQNSGSESSPQQCEVKQSEKTKLEEADEYLRDVRCQPVKLVKKILKKQMQVKQVYKSSRQMQVLDIKQVNSIFPNNVLALIPSSFLRQKKKVSTCNFGSQTENSPIIKIYETCKEQENKLYYNPQCPSSEIIIGKGKLQSTASNLLRSNILSRPKSSASDGTFFTTMNPHRAAHSKQSKKRQQLSHCKKIYSQSAQKIEKSTQTTLTFNNPTISNLRARFEKEICILEYKAIDPSFSTLQYGRNKIEIKNMGQTLSKNIFENMKTRKRNPL